MELVRYLATLFTFVRVTKVTANENDYQYVCLKAFKYFNYE